MVTLCQVTGDPGELAALHSEAILTDKRVGEEVTGRP
jgi:hypothetical protein